MNNTGEDRRIATAEFVGILTFIFVVVSNPASLPGYIQIVVLAVVTICGCAALWAVTMPNLIRILATCFVVVYGCVAGYKEMSQRGPLPLIIPHTTDVAFDSSRPGQLLGDIGYSKNDESPTV
ncbi:MAG TPA: hypothetical protein VFE17_05310, partial [Candidatus Baltobacteraceae bacterium]|nr:hypothetical protein [Candidatus Baltobacteraceae bacterium]